MVSLFQTRQDHPKEHPISDMIDREINGPGSCDVILKKCDDNNDDGWLDDTVYESGPVACEPEVTVAQ